MLKSLTLRDVGPAPEMSVQWAQRLNFIAGDNGLGKTFLLDIAWWALTRTWARLPTSPSRHPDSRPSIRFRHTASKGQDYEYESKFSREGQSWSTKAGRPPIPGMVIYAQVDGGFSAWDRQVRQPGLAAIAELVGEQPATPRRGRKRAKVAESREAIPASEFPTFWTRAMGDLLKGYERICSYVCTYIEPVTGDPTIDHMAPKSRRWDRVYEWDNYRLACGLILDPFEVQPGWFVLEFTECQVLPGPKLTPATQARVEHTIRVLGLNDYNCRQLRLEYVKAYERGEISGDYLRRRAPFIADELQRQGLLKPGV